MRGANSKCWLILLLLFSCTPLAAQVKPADQSLYTSFEDPPREYSPMPFWFWNGKLDGAVVQEQIRQMTDQHVYGAFLHARDGLQTPYLSEEWYKAFGAGLEESKRNGFHFNFVDEYNWPSGEVRNIWMAGNHQSEVLARRPDYRMKTIAYKEQLVHGPTVATLPKMENVQAVLAARWLGAGQIDSDSIRSVELPADSSRVQYNAPEGDWLLMGFYLEPATGFDGGVVDLMNPEAMKLYFDLSYGEYYRRFKPYFGSTITAAFSDHEGVFGYRIAWTPALYESFQKRNGYDLRATLPLLMYDGGPRSAQVRQDYLATVTQLYQDSYWTGITNQAKELGIGRTGHAWEEALQSASVFEGSLFAVERGLNPVGVDSLGDFGRQPLNFKVAQSVADFEGRKFACENQGVQGNDSYLDMQGLRKATNAIGLWGVNLFIPHAFNYDVLRANYPPDWLHQPYWPYFSRYADYTRRISFMNGEGSRHVTSVLLYYPIRSVWAESQPLFSNQTDYAKLSDPLFWKNRVGLINDYYDRIMLRLTERQWDYNVADDEYLERSHIEGKELVIGTQRFRAVVLPPTTVMTPKTLEKLVAFYRAGGMVLGIRILPEAAAKTEDAEAIHVGIAEIFGADAAKTPLPYTESQSVGGGQSYYVAESVETLIDVLDGKLTKDVRVTSGAPEHLYTQHRQKGGTDYYWMVNDSAKERSNRVQFSVQGVPEKWDALTGAHSPLFYVNKPDGTEVWLDFDAWDAYFIVFRASTGAPQRAELVTTNAKSLELLAQDATSMVVRATATAGQGDVAVTLKAGGKTFHGEARLPSSEAVVLTGPWQFRTEANQVAVPYARVRDAAPGTGEQLGYAQGGYDDSAWSPLWLSEAQNTIRNWNVIGPFSNQDDTGYAKEFPPESKFDGNAHYAGAGGAPVHWQRYYGDEPHLSKAEIVLETTGGPFDDDAAAVDLNRVFGLADSAWMLGYAQTYLYSPAEQSATFIVASDNWAKVWVNQKQVFGQLRHPFWYELNDNWADRFPVVLKKGWNEVLVKVGVGRGAATGTFGFTFRVADEHGDTIRSIVDSLAPQAAKPPSFAAAKSRWYRVAVPPGVVAFLPPAFGEKYRTFLNGAELKVEGNSAVRIEERLTAGKNVLVFEAPGDAHLSAPVVFLSGNTSFELKSWTNTGLANFSGSAIYEKSFDLPKSLEGKRVVLSLGRVSSVAEVQLNGHDLGALVWEPYRLDVTPYVESGENQLRIRVTNTEANARAVGSSHNILANIELSGLEGPVELVPYEEATLTLVPE